MGGRLKHYSIKILYYMLAKMIRLLFTNYSRFAGTNVSFITHGIHADNLTHSVQGTTA
jgi:hypothetical protein